MNETPESKWHKHNRELRGRNDEQERLQELGWKSTGDLPFEFGQEFQRSYNTLSKKIPEFVEKILEGKTEKFREAHVRKIGNDTFVSPHLTRSLKHQVKVFYKLAH